MKDFWTHSIWYISLGILSLMVLFYTLCRSKVWKRDLGFFFAIFGLTLMVETVVYVFLKAYEYYPLIIPDSPKDDGVLGNIFSQFSISAVALYICVRKVSFIKKILVGALFYAIENLFLALEIYRTYWYRPWLTFLGLMILFQIFTKWYNVAFRSNRPVIRYFTILLGVLSLYLPTTNWLGILFGLYDVKDDILIDPFISHAIISIPKYLILLNLICWLHLKKAKWTWYLVCATGLLIIDIILYQTHLLYVYNGFVVLYSAISILTVYLYVYVVHKLLYGKNH